MVFEIHGITGQGSAGTLNNSPPVGTPSRKPARGKPQAQQKANVQNHRQQQLEAEQRAQEARQASQKRIEQDVERSLQQLETIRLPFNHKLKYSVDFESHEVMVKIIDLTTNEVIKELPAVAARRLHERLQEFIGLLVDKEV